MDTIEKNAPANYPHYPEMAGKVVLITGGSRGIGLETARAFANQDCRVLIASRNEGRAKTALKKLADAGDVAWHGVNVASEKSVESLFEYVQSTYGQLHYAFNNGGNGGVPARLQDLSLSSWKTTVDGYLTSVFLAMRGELSIMSGKDAVIVNNASISGLRGQGMPGSAAYHAAKHGVIGLTKATARENARIGPRVCAICPGLVETQSMMNWASRHPEDASDIRERIPSGTAVPVSQIAAAVLWLCSTGAAHAIGTILTIDGGETA